MSEIPKYFMYFPGNYRWSSAFINMLGRTPYGGTDISELHKVGRQLQGKAPSDDEAWFDAFMPVADEVLERGKQFEASGHRVSAAAFYLRACHYYQMGERFRTPKDERAQDAYRKSIDCFHRFAELSDYGIEVVEVPFVDGSLPGYFVPAQNSKGERSPCVVFFDGLDVTKEIQFLLGVPDLIKRGISVLIMDGPGTGESVRFRGHYLRHDYEVAGSACIDYLETRSDVDAKKVGVVAISLGGYYAPRMASMEPRFAACVAWGAIWDYHAVWKRRIEAQFNASMSVPGHHISWILGVDTVKEALRRLEPFRLDGVVQKMRCPFLVTHGEDDEQVPLKDAYALYNAVGSADKTIRVFNGEEGGAQHCQRDYLTYGVSTIWGFFEDKLVHGR
jgi:dienelactone hydrolase